MITVAAAIELASEILTAAIAAKKMGAAKVDVGPLVDKTHADELSSNAAAHAELDARFPK